MAVRFAATTDYLARTANLPSWGGGFTMTAWALARTSLSADTLWKTVLAMGSTASTGPRISIGAVNNSGVKWEVFRYWSTVRGDYAFRRLPPAGLPVFCALTWDGTNAAMGYTRLWGQQQLEGVTAATPAGSSWANFRVGNSTYDGTDWWLGDIWDVKLWDRPMSAAEVLRESGFREPQNRAALNGWWPLEGSINGTDAAGLLDWSGNDRHLAVAGTPVATRVSERFLNPWKPKRLVSLPSAEVPILPGRVSWFRETAGHNTSTNYTTSTSIAVKRGDLLIVSNKWELNDAASPTTADSGGNTYTNLTKINGPGANQTSVRLSYAVAKADATLTFTQQPVGSTLGYRSISVAVYRAPLGYAWNYVGEATDNAQNTYVKIDGGVTASGAGLAFCGWGEYDVWSGTQVPDAGWEYLVATFNSYGGNALAKTFSLSSPTAVIPGTTVGSSARWSAAMAVWTLTPLDVYLVGTSAAESNATSEDLTLPWPAGVQAGDFAVVLVSWYADSVYNAAPTNVGTGFEQRVLSDLAGGAVGLNDAAWAVYTKDIAAAESGNVVVDFNASAGTNYANAMLAVFRGRGALTYASLGAHNGGTSSDATATGVTATAGQLLLALYGLSDPPDATNANPSGMELAVQGGVLTDAGAIFFAEASAGATGNKTWDFTTSRQWAARLMLVNDAGATSPVVALIKNAYRALRGLLVR